MSADHVHTWVARPHPDDTTADCSSCFEAAILMGGKWHAAPSRRAKGKPRMPLVVDQPPAGEPPAPAQPPAGEPPAPAGEITTETADGGAVLSADGLYRYRLWRSIPVNVASDELGARCTYVMLNPSTADAMLDDPTIRKCRGFAERWGCVRFDVVNLYGFRSTDPDQLWKVPDSIGPRNDHWLLEACGESQLVVAAWGAHADRGRAEQVRQLLAKLPPLGNHVRDLRILSQPGKPLLTGNGQPRHPLMLPYTSSLVAWA